MRAYFGRGSAILDTGSKGSLRWMDFVLAFHQDGCQTREENYPGYAILDEKDYLQL